MERVQPLRLAAPSLIVFSLVALATAAPSWAEGGRLADHLPGFEVARCAFPQGKLVLEKGGDFHVLRQGDVLPGLPRVRVYEISERRAVLFEAATGAGDGSAVPNRILKIDQAPDGTTRVTLLGADLARSEQVDLLGEGHQLLSLTSADLGPPADDEPSGDTTKQSGENP